uniref:Uncharacterized protein n=1 Tax=Triticum urartu TaxID=4572 RepID=A0A8R7K3C6_TRIUA
MFDRIDICKSCLCIITSFDCYFTNNCECNSVFVVLFSCKFTFQNHHLIFFNIVVCY